MYRARIAIVIGPLQWYVLAMQRGRSSRIGVASVMHDLSVYSIKTLILAPTLPLCVQLIFLLIDIHRQVS